MHTSHESPLCFDDVGMTYPDGTEAVANISFTVEPGEMVTVVGPSGCGKSTLLRLASGLLAPTRGVVRVDRDEIGYVFQEATLLPWRTVRRNVELLTELHEIDAAERARRASEAIELVGLGGFEEHHPKQLSGGMKMRVSLARSLTLDPSVFLFDEPFGALDEITRERLNDELLHLFSLRRFAGLFITHSVYEAIYMSTRVLVMSARPGRLIGEFDVPFGFPRDDDFRFSAEFAEISGQVSDALRMSHA